MLMQYLLYFNYYAHTITFTLHHMTWVLLLTHLTNEGIELQRVNFSSKELKLLTAMLRLTFRLSPDLFS